MKTIEERAREYASDELNPNYAIPAYIASKQQKAYIAGATDQREIDIEKACGILEDMTEGRLGKRFISEFKNKLEYGVLERH